MQRRQHAQMFSRQTETGAGQRWGRADTQKTTSKHRTFVQVGDGHLLQDDLALLDFLHLAVKAQRARSLVRVAQRDLVPARARAQALQVDGHLADEVIGHAVLLRAGARWVLRAGGGGGGSSSTPATPLSLSAVDLLILTDAAPDV